MTNTAPAVDTEQQYEIVYQAVVAVAARCDGALEEDGVGFNGQDTKFGRRIASVPFSEWTPEIKDEAASIIIKYRKQVEAYTGIDVATLDVVNEARGSGTARDQARQIERRQQAVTGRSVDAAADESSIFVVRWGKRDPEFQTFLDAVRALPGRNWNGQEWHVPLTREAAVALSTGALKDLPLTAAAEAHVERLLATPVVEEAPAAVKPHVWLHEGGQRVVIDFPYSQEAVAAVRRLPGRDWDRTVAKKNTADLDPAVLAFADEINLVVDPAVVEAINNLGATKAAVQTEAQIRRAVSGLANPADLPAEFVQRVLAACPKAEVA